MIVFSALVPYPPVFTAASDNAHKSKLKKTLLAYNKLAEELYASKPDVVVLITRHHDRIGPVFSASLSEEYLTSMKELGDFETSSTFNSDLALLQEIKERCMEETPVTLVSESTLEYPAAIPLHLLTQEIPDINIVPLYYSLQSSADHVRFGEHLREVFEGTTKRIAVIACGNLSHCVTEAGPGTFRPEGQQFDQLILKALKSGKSERLLEIDDQFIKSAQECGFKPILVLHGLLKDQHYTSDVLAYEHPFGVGYLTANFKLY